MLLVHGLLHLLGYDHEIGVEESMAMAAAERHILDALGWKVRLSSEAATSEWKPELILRYFGLRLLLRKVLCLLSTWNRRLALVCSGGRADRPSRGLK